MIVRGLIRAIGCWQLSISFHSRVAVSDEPVNRQKKNVKKKIVTNKNFSGPVRDLNPGPLAPKARIIPLDQQAAVCECRQ